jgi:hypothetical protein
MMLSKLHIMVVIIGKYMIFIIYLEFVVSIIAQILFLYAIFKCRLYTKGYIKALIPLILITIIGNISIFIFPLLKVFL